MKANAYRTIILLPACCVLALSGSVSIPMFAATTTHGPLYQIQRRNRINNSGDKTYADLPNILRF